MPFAPRPTFAWQGTTITPVFVADDEVDLTGAITASGADSADAFVPLIAQSGCVQVANALASLELEVPVATTGLCAAKEVTNQVGDPIDGWHITFAGVPIAVGEGVDPEVDQFLATYPEYGNTDLEFVSATGAGWGQMLAIWAAASDMDANDLSHEAFSAAQMAYTGAIPLGPRSVSCPGPVFPTVCAGGIRVFQIQGKEFVDATGGKPVIAFGS